MQESVMTNPEAYARWLLERRLAPEHQVRYFAAWC